MKSGIKLIATIILLTTVTFVKCKGCKREDDSINYWRVSYNPIECSKITLDSKNPLRNFVQNISYSYYTNSKKLFISKSKIPVLENSIFFEFDSVTLLALNENGIVDIQPSSFSVMNKLEEIQLRYNKIIKINKNSFDGLDKLKKLDLSYNNLTTFDNILLPNLQMLSLSNNNFSDIANIADNRLLILDLSNNKVTKLDIIFQTFSSLKTLNASNNNIVHINEIDHTSLETLDLSKNKLTNLDFISKINTLKTLNVSFNLIQAISKNHFENSENLETVDLSDNFITYLPPNLFYNSHNMTNFFLKNNSLNHFPNNLFYKKIDNVDLSSNLMRKFDCEQIQGTSVSQFNFIDTICHFGDDVTYIDFSESDVVHITNGSFKHLKNLEFLNLSMNFLETVHVDAFENLSALKFLSISKNFVRIIHIGTFSPLASLETLDLSYNEIGNFEVGTFTGLNVLTTLNISHNHIKYIDPQVFYSLPDLKDLNMIENPLVTLDHESLTSHLVSLRSLSVNFVKEKCSALLKTLSNYNKIDIKIVPGNTTNTNNIHGIACDPDDPEFVALQEDEEEFRKARSYIIAMYTSLILIAILFYILFISYTISWCKKQFENELGYVKKNGKSCSLTLLTENDHE